MKLVIVESPAKAKTIKKYLGGAEDDFVVKASVGHVRDLPKSNKNAIDIEAGFLPHYEIARGKQKVVNELIEEAAKAEEVILATDPDREGEAIAWHLLEALDLDPKRTKRVAFNEITQSAIEEAMAHPRVIDDNLRHAQEARRVLDRLVGYDLSGLIWKKVRYGLSAGRVQSPALRILMEREREIRAFVPEDYWTITARVAADKGEPFEVLCSEEPRERSEVERILAEGKAGAWEVVDIKESEAKRAPRPPFITSTLQQAASTRLGFSPSRTMGAAQKLYEAGAITYMRTDSTTLSNQALGAIGSLIEKDFGKDYLEVRTYKTSSRNAQEAHEAVRPTDMFKRAAGSTEDQKRLYTLIWQRTIASQMKDAQMKKTKLLANTTTRALPDFFVNGSRVVFDGWLKVDPAARSEDTEVPKLSAKDPLTLKSIEDEAKQTQPPSRYSEAGLIKELEKRGIGRPSTYASIMKTLVDRGYVEKEGRTLMPTITGDVVSSFLEEHFPTYISDTFTAEMENELDEIAEGKRKYAKTLSEFYTPFQKALASKESIEKQTSLGEAPEEFPCPLCGGAMEYKLGRGGSFMSCTRFPECHGARTQDGRELKADEPIGEHPESGEPIYVLEGRFGPYLQAGESKGKDGKKKKQKPRRASIPPEYDIDSITMEDAVKFLSVPRVLGEHPESGEPITASIGRFGPYIVHESDFRSLKEDDVYSIELPRALEILKEPKQRRGGGEVVREVGEHPRTKNQIKLYKNKQGHYLKRGFKNVYLPESVDIEKLTVEEALEHLKKDK